MVIRRNVGSPNKPKDRESFDRRMRWADGDTLMVATEVPLRNFKVFRKAFESEEMTIMSKRWRGTKRDSYVHQAVIREILL